ncbi:LysR family transcriptional regulator [Acetobacter sp. DmW_136]|uniref:helix-turn-helix domain-containing protein n=1 Tax=Acetobacter sp. DmW_136 TaxID=2591091 RepID=UPI001239DB9A|nr:LysR family transcriptional regulator [Acetobacter sp. DmW_136]KAA8386524.1 LysR family transcriptional regulator [Acetobacter sp. DmW_136]
MKNSFEGVSVFLATVEAGGFALAAKCLGLSRSAVAKTIGRIEHRLGVKWFDRMTRLNSLMEEGIFTTNGVFVPSKNFELVNISGVRTL